MKFFQCFDKTAEQFMLLGKDEDKNLIVCHGIIEAGKPGSAGTTGHAWIEKDANIFGGRIAVDATSKVLCNKDKYREDLKARNVVEYSPREFLYNWWKHGYPGPWDSEIKLVTR